MKKKVLITLASLLGAFAAALFGGHAWLKGRFEKEQIVAQMEAAWSCRAQLDGTVVTLLSKPSRVELRGLKLAPHDAVTGMPLGQRPPLDGNAALLSLERVELEVEPMDLLRGKLNVKHLHLYGLGVKTEVRENGESSLRDLFMKPGSEKKKDAKSADAADSKTIAVNAQQGGATDVKVVDVVAPPKPGDSAAKVRKSEFKAGDMMVALQVDEASVDNASFTMTNLGNGTQVVVEHVNFSLKNIDVNPDDLANHNRCDLIYEGALRVEKIEDKTQVANFTVSGSGKMVPFDQETRDWDPDLNLTALLKKGALLGGLPMDQQLSKKDMKKFTDWGLDMSSILVGGVLGEDAATEVHVVHGKTILKQDTRLVFPQYEITMLEGSWFHAGLDAIKAKGTLVAGPELTKKILGTARETIIKKIGVESLADLAVSLLEKTLIDDQKRLDFPFRAKGRLSSPVIEPDSTLGDIKDVLQDTGKSLLKGLLGN